MISEANVFYPIIFAIIEVNPSFESFPHKSVNNKTMLERIVGKENENRTADIIFVHGLGGNARSTWHPKGKLDDDDFWPVWLGTDSLYLNIWSFGYGAEATNWRNNSSMPLFDQASNLLDWLESRDLGKRPLIFITHSLGGLLVKKMLMSALTFKKTEILEQTKGVVFLATPHTGSHLANLIDNIGLLARNTVTVQELKAHTPQLSELNEWYRENAYSQNIATKVYYETQPVKGVLVVNRDSANPGIQGVKPVAMPDDHISICKPVSEDSQVYLGVKQFIKDCLTCDQPSQIVKFPDRSSQPEPKKKAMKTPSNLKLTGSSNFVGREDKLEKLYQLLQQNERVTIPAMAEMGGIGKTELALQYALKYNEHYPGSLCWFSVRGENLGTQIIEFAASYLNLFSPKELESDIAKVNYCWQNWRSEPSLIILDDVLDYGQFYREKIKPYLPPSTSMIKVLMTSRERPGANISRIDLDVLTEAKALELLEALIGKSRIEAELELAKKLCKWLGYLPLGLELVGRYLEIDPSLTLESTLENLKNQQLKAEELLEPEQEDMTAQLGVAAAFELSWQELNPEAQRLGCYLSLFTSEAFKWLWVEKDLQNQKRDLLKRNLLQTIPNSESPTEYQYKLHSLIAQYFRSKLEEHEQSAELKQKFCAVMMAIAGSIPPIPTQQYIRAVIMAIPHIRSVATDLTEYIDNEKLIFPYVGLGRFYQGQGIYSQAEQWIKQSLSIAQKRLGKQHLYVAISLNELAKLYYSQGRYRESETLHSQVLELRKQLLGEQHPDVANSLNNLAGFYLSQRRYEEAQSLYWQSLELINKLLDQKHPYVISSLNNLAGLYAHQGRYEEAEPLFLQALELYKQVLGEQHPDVATVLNNLACLYDYQGRYEEAESCYLQALELLKQVLGEQHLNVVDILIKLSVFYESQERNEEAVLFYRHVLRILEDTLGENHPNTNTIRNNLKILIEKKLNSQ